MENTAPWRDSLLPDDGLVAGYVRGGRSRRLRPVLQPGNGVALSLSQRVDTQLASATVELTAARAALATSAAGAAALEWLTSLTAAALSEGVPHPPLFEALEALTDRHCRRCRAPNRSSKAWCAMNICSSPNWALASTSAAVPPPVQPPTWRMFPRNRARPCRAAPACPMPPGCCRCPAS